MFVSSENWTPPELEARQPTREQAGFLETIGAGFRAERIETDSYQQVHRARRDITDDLRSAISETLGEDAFDQNAVPEGQHPRNIISLNEGVREGADLYRLAQEAASQDPERFRDLPTTQDAMNEAVRGQMQAEYADLMETIGYSQSPGLPRFLGAFGAAATDPTSLALGAVSGGTGTIARIFAREAALGAFGEALILPRQYRMSEYLEIDDPNPAQQIAMGAAFGGLLFGGGKALTRTGRQEVSAELSRAVAYARTRTGAIPRDVEPSIAAEAAITSAEQAIDQTPEIFDFPKPQRQEPIEPPFDVSSRQEPIEQQIDEIEAGYMAEIETLRAEIGGRVKPISDFLMGGSLNEDLPGGGIRTGQIAPGGRAAEELKVLGITPQSRPGLFSRQGREEFDNLVADEMEEMFPGLSDIAGRDGSYLNQEGFLNVLARELNNEPSDLRAPARLREMEAEMEEYQRGRDAADPSIEPVDFSGDATEVAADIERVSSEVDASINDLGIGRHLTYEEIETIKNTIGQYGGTIEQSLDEIDRLDLDRAKRVDGPQDASRNDPPNAEQLPQRGGDAGELGVRGAEADSPAGEGADRVARTEQTDAGEQFVTPGIDPITGRDRLEQAQRAPIGGGIQGPDSEIGGMFDPHDKARMDLFADPESPELESMNVSAARDMRETIETDGDFDVTMLNDAGDPVTLRASEWLDDLEADEAIVREAGICRVGRTE